MSKRAADDSESSPNVLKKGERPTNGSIDNAGSDEEFEDEFEDEFESENDFLEAGVDGRPDAEREAEEKGMWTTLVALCEFCWMPSLSFD